MLPFVLFHLLQWCCKKSAFFLFSRLKNPIFVEKKQKLNTNLIDLGIFFAAILQKEKHFQSGNKFKAGNNFFFVMIYLLYNKGHHHQAVDGQESEYRPQIDVGFWSFAPL